MAQRSIRELPQHLGALDHVQRSGPENTRATPVTHGQHEAALESPECSTYRLPGHAEGLGQLPFTRQQITCLKDPELDRLGELVSHTDADRIGPGSRTVCERSVTASP
jgi:hypothetical protein